MGETNEKVKWKIRARSAHDHIEIGPFNTKEEAEKAVEEHNRHRSNRSTRGKDLVQPFNC